ncbi:MAG: RNA methyltransferase [Myxococcales bacterium]|nr:RNA methyltransferase [Myxococcales bacterium]
MKGHEVDALLDEYGVDAVLEAATPFLEDTRIARLEEGLDAKLQSLTIVLENLYDPHNGAAAVRSAEAFGLCDLHTVDGTTGVFHAAPDVCLGTQKWMDLHSHHSAAECASSLREQGFVMCATVPGSELELEDIPVDKPLAIWFGNERDGLSSKAQALCDHRVSIEMHGFCQSFNLSVSVAMFVHRLAAKRRAYLGAVGDLSPGRRELLRARWRGTSVRGLDKVLRRARQEKVASGQSVSS